jgi:hypothetical protein
MYDIETGRGAVTSFVYDSFWGKKGLDRGLLAARHSCYETLLEAIANKESE